MRTPLKGGNGSLTTSNSEGAPMIQMWKLPHILKGILTHVPPLNALRLRRASTGGTNSPQYCYEIWHRNSKMLREMGFNPAGVTMVELGPGDTIGVGLTALLYGVRLYTGLDAVPYPRSFNSAFD